MKMKILKYKKCKELPAPLWLFCMELAHFRELNESTKAISQLISTQSMWQTTKEFYKMELQLLKNEIKSKGEAFYKFMKVYEEKVLGV